MDRNPRTIEAAWRDSSGMTPEQFGVLFGPSRREGPEFHLMGAVLARAVRDYLTLAPRGERPAGVGFGTVCAWLASPASDGPFAFERICEVLDLDGDAVRQSLARQLASLRAGRQPRPLAYRNSAERRLRRHCSKDQAPRKPARSVAA